MNFHYLISLLKERGGTFLSLLVKGKFLKAVNYFSANISMVRKPDIVNHYPIILVIDPGNICNLSCALCITGQKKSLRPPKFLKFSDFKKIIDQLGKWSVKLDLYNWGEPFLNKDTLNMITYAKRFGLEVTISSNLNIFNQEIAKQIITSGLDRLIVSLHGATPKSTQSYMKGTNFLQVIKNLKLVIKTKKELGSKTPQIIWRYVVSSFNEKALGKAEILARKLGVDYFEPLPIKPDVGFDPSWVEKNLKRNACWLPKNKRFLSYDVEKNIPLNGISNCFWPWEMVSINSDGTVQPCCVFSNPAFDFGNVLETPFWQIWNGKKYQTARKTLRERIRTDKSTICGLCLASNFISR